ncbi:hypothetical protein [Mucilaginibacter sp. L3T2-6]|uniref:hypothetical protein n=1 Tax=Mucilaginibacter sp. L3T2-6 TaxID=3062491 RepID=UPI002675A7F6|nr:hypothetical protein [Mucilaginibacter sp. L3T2-6]MDO3640427.1 hypothetical protein [Mucilaginibacter sp. L3T2-6]MDV6213234.1 hypothetical protein [Mucilaginibacter sp. L3T2-6]
MQTGTNLLHIKLSGLALIVAPLLFGASTFFWQNGEYGPTAAVLLTLSNAFWIPALIALFGFIKNKMPVYYPIGLFVAICGSCIGGNSFSYLGYFTTVFGISHQTYISTLAHYPISSGILIFWAGPLFPLSLLVLGINLIRKRTIETWLGILICLGAIVFPLGRILRIEVVAHLTDLLFAVPFFVIGWRFINSRGSVSQFAQA